MRLLFSFLLGLSIVLTGSLSLPEITLAAPPPEIAALPLVKNLFAGQSPDNLGLTNDRLSPCPSTSNCVVSQGDDTTHAILPIAYSVDTETAREYLLKVLAVVPSTTIVETGDNYIRSQSSSRLLGFIDDTEFYFPSNEKIIHLRSASRLGESDLGVNRRRLEQIRLALKDLKI
jgi:uncharacterized protein (DUF1499 family)